MAPAVALVLAVAIGIITYVRGVRIGLEEAVEEKELATRIGER